MPMTGQATKAGDRREEGSTLLEWLAGRQPAMIAAPESAAAAHPTALERGAGLAKVSASAMARVRQRDQHGERGIMVWQQRLR
jgi:hypothetical protein